MEKAILIKTLFDKEVVITSEGIYHLVHLKLVCLGLQEGSLAAYCTSVF